MSAVSALTIPVLLFSLTAHLSVCFVHRCNLNPVDSHVLIKYCLFNCSFFHGMSLTGTRLMENQANQVTFCCPEENCYIDLQFIILKMEKDCWHIFNNTFCHDESKKNKQTHKQIKLLDFYYLDIFNILYVLYNRESHCFVWSLESSFTRFWVHFGSIMAEIVPTLKKKNSLNYDLLFCSFFHSITQTRHDQWQRKFIKSSKWKSIHPFKHKLHGRAL